MKREVKRRRPRRSKSEKQHDEILKKAKVCANGYKKIERIITFGTDKVFVSYFEPPRYES